MEYDVCPVRIEELKRQLRLPDTDEFDEQLRLSLMAAVGWCENYSGRKLESFQGGDIPYQLRAAILMYAAYLFENPSDTVAEKVTAAQRLADPLIWQNYGT